MNETLKPVQRFFKLLELDRKDILYIYLYAVFAGLITLSLPLGIQAIIGLIAGGAISASLVLLIAGVTVATMLSGVLRIMQMTVSETIQRRIFARSAFDFTHRIPRLRLDALTRFYPPELMNRFFDTLTLQKGLPKILMDISTAILQIVFGLVLISFYHPFFVFFGLVLILIVVMIFRITGPGGLKTSLKESKYKYAVAHWLEELARAMTTFKLAGNTSFPLRKTDDEVMNYLTSRKAHFRILLFQYGNIVGFKTVVTAALLALGSYLVVQNQINIGQFVAAEIVVILVMASVEKLILNMETIYDVLTALEKLGTVTDLPLEEEKGQDFSEIVGEGGIGVQIRDLTYCFDDSEQLTIDHLSLDIKPGERICVAGYNNSGKSTLIKIIGGLYTNFKGNISYNGIPFGNLNLRSLRAHIGDYCSEEDIFSGTIMENMALCEEDIPMEKLLSASQAVGLHDYVQDLPQGYNTHLLPEGKNIPKSVRAKIILVRSLATRPRLLAIEALFKNFERADRIRAAEILTSRENNWTFIGVSNDPELAKRCDRVVIMQKGRIVEVGAFEDLLDSPHFRSVFLAPQSDPIYKL